MIITTNIYGPHLPYIVSKLGIAGVKLTSKQDAILMTRFGGERCHSVAIGPAYNEDSLILANYLASAALQDFSKADIGTLDAAKDLHRKLTNRILALEEYLRCTT
jgi:hypothetical protein